MKDLEQPPLKDIAAKYWRLGLVTLVLVVIAGVGIVSAKPNVKTSSTYTVTKPIDFQTQTTQTCSLPQGTNQVTTPGKNGVETVVYKINYVNGKKVSVDSLSDKTTMKPVTEVIIEGENQDKTPGSASSALDYALTSCGQQTALTCGIDQMYLGYAMNKSLTMQQYQALIQPLQKDSCSNIPPYCTFTPSTPCSTTSSTSASTDNSGYDAGYNYAEENQICDTNYTDGNSSDFNQGVQDWASSNCTDGQPN